jgi:hypothetical protein
MIGTLGVAHMANADECKNPKPKFWSDGAAIVATPAAGPFLVCTGYPITLSVTAVDKDTYVIECVEDATKTKTEPNNEDALTYQWSGNPRLVAPTNGSSVVFNAPLWPGTYTIRCTVDDPPTPVVAPEDGERDDTEKIVEFKVCAIDSTPIPTEVTSLDWGPAQPAPTPENPNPADIHLVPPPADRDPNDFGYTKREFSLDYTPYFDCPTKTWKFKMTTATASATYWAALPIGDANDPDPDHHVKEASVAAATTQAIYCAMKNDLVTRNRDTDRGWWNTAASLAHEKKHAENFKTFANAAFPAAKAAVDAASMPAVTTFNPNGSCQVESIEAIKAVFDVQMQGIQLAMQAAIDAESAEHDLPDDKDATNPELEAVEDAANEQLIADLDEKAAMNNWTCN